MRGATFLALRCSRKARSTAPQQLSHIVGMALALSILPGPTSFSSISHESTPTAPAVRPTILASAAASWKVVLTGGMHPPGRYAAAMAYDPLDGYVVLFGGVHVGVFLGDTWTFPTGTWSRCFIPHPPNRSVA